MIRVACPNCGTKLRGPDEAAGKRVKCPKCGDAVVMPEPIYEAEPLDAEQAPSGIYDLDPAPLPAGPPGTGGGTGDDARKPCPVCGEMIIATAAKCRFCGEVFDKKLKKVKKTSQSDADMTTGDWAVAILCSGIGCIAGVVWMIQGKPKGRKMFGVSLLMGFLWNVISVAIQSALKQNAP